jgi:hypothetical protein
LIMQFLLWTRRVFAWVSRELAVDKRGHALGQPAGLRGGSRRAWVLSRPIGGKRWTGKDARPLQAVGGEAMRRGVFEDL